MMVVIYVPVYKVKVTVSQDRPMLKPDSTPSHLSPSQLLISIANELPAHYVFHSLELPVYFRLEPWFHACVLGRIDHGCPMTFKEIWRS